MKNKIIISFIFLLISIYISGNNVVNPLNYGLRNAKNGIDTYRILKKCHDDAVLHGYDISYRGIDSLFIEIPSDAKSIPLPEYTNFANTKITVKNNSKNLYLFARKSSSQTIEINGTDIESGNFANIGNIDNGLWLFVISDQNPWVENRIGYSYGATRKDIIVVESKKGRNKPTMPYNNAYSSPSAKAIKVTTDKIEFKNLTFNRTSDSKYKTYIVSFDGQYNLALSNITLHTPEDSVKYADEAISITNSANVILDHITINGTYSLKKQYGYGISLNNIYNLLVTNMYARANWGVFGTNNINTATLKDCDINRFDIHCYGRDVKSINCRYSTLYNQFSSVYGYVSYDNCIFDDFTPVLIESSYNAYTPFDLSFRRCTFNFTKNHYYIMTLMRLEATHNSRPELSNKCLPNITMNTCTVNLDKEIKKWYIVYTGKVTYKERLEYISKISIRDLTITGDGNLDIFTNKVETTNTLKVLLSRIKKKTGNTIEKIKINKITVGNNSTITYNGKRLKH